jgi:hypothetical protein
MPPNSIKKSEVFIGENAEARECLLVILQPELVLAKIRPWPLFGFVCEGRYYRDSELGEWTGFYDWLRDADSNVLGVRYWLSSETEFLAGYAKDLPYVQIVPSQAVEIYFSGQRTINQSLSCDQDFLYDGIFRSDDGTYAIGFGTGRPGEINFAGLKDSGAIWKEVERTIE